MKLTYNEFLRRYFPRTFLRMREEADMRPEGVKGAEKALEKARKILMRGDN